MKNNNYYNLRRNVLRELADAFSVIQDNFKYFKNLNKNNTKVLGACEWLLDNIYLIEKEYKLIKKEMPLDYFKGLPSLNDFRPRIFTKAKNYINQSKEIDLNELTKYINEIQETNAEEKISFTMGELWAFPLMLKSAIIINLSQYIEKLSKLQKNILSEKEFPNLQEEHLERNIGEYITAIRKIEGVNWRVFFEKTSLVEKILENDPIEVYKSMDFDSKDYYRHKIEVISNASGKDEITVASNALNLAKTSYKNKDEDYKCHVGYYLIDEGNSELENNKHHIFSQGEYVSLNIFGTILLSFFVLFISKSFGTIYTLKEYIISFLIILIPINEVIIGIINWTVSKVVKIKKVPKINYNMGIPFNAKTVVVIPAIVNCKEKVIELMEKLEVYYSGNKDKNVYFALLNDFQDSDNEVEENDKEIIEAGIKCAQNLNKKYAKDNNENIFFFLSRSRVYNKKQKKYMGNERKRGKLMEFIGLIRGSKNHTYNVVSSDINELAKVKYLITLDEDTFMPRESVFKLVGAMSHVLNVPHIKNNKVIRGYGIMQPKVSISLESTNKTCFSKIFAGENSVDGYSVAYSDTYQDLFGEGSFVGKGIINIDEFYERLKDTIKDNRVLSHDLLEGAICRSALVSDIELIDDYPSFYESSCTRLHRWVRGDWQLIGWLFSSKISLLNKWKIYDNLRRSLLAPNLLIALILSLTILNGRNQITLLCFLAVIMSLVFTVTDFVVTPKNKLMGTFKTLKQILLIITFIPYQAFLMLDAILLTLFRVCISRKNLLEWKSSQAVERCCTNSLKGYTKKMWIGPIMALLVIYLSLNNSLGVVTYTLVVASLWVCSPYVAYLISKDLPCNKKELDYSEKSYLRQISRRTYAYYEDFINEENNYLAPDNYQERPFKGVAHRTSPTNIGMGIISEVIGYDLGYITMSEFINKTELILKNMKDLKKVHGHFLNWYDTRTKEPLYPKYVSTVDSGNLLANLWILRKAIEELKENPVIRTKEIMSLKDIYKIIEKENCNIKIRFTSSISLGAYVEVLEEILDRLAKNYKKESNEFNSETNNIKENTKGEIEYWLNKLICEANKKKNYYNDMFKGLEKIYSKDFLEGVPNLFELRQACSTYKQDYGDDFKATLNRKVNNIDKYINKIDSIIKDIDEFTEEMDFKFLYDKSRMLFSIGYNVEENSLGNSYYDLLASESRIASFVSIAKNDVPKEHWFKLSRAMTNAFHTHSLVSWSGTMFEYFMPSLIMRSYPQTLLSRTYKDVIKAQMSFAKQKKIPWGISESAFYEFDSEENYQYKAFGVPGLGLKRGLEDEIVVSPYSTLITLPFSRKKGLKNLERLEKCGALGRYGFIESIDYTKAREDKYIFNEINPNYTQNVNNFKKTVDNYNNIVDNDGDKFDEKEYDASVNNVHNFSEKTRNCELIRDESRDKILNNPQNDNIKQENLKIESYPQEDCHIYKDGIRPNKIITYMVHHLGMSFMALENTLMDNILINRFHSLPQVKATELLLKEKIPQYVTFERSEDFSIKNRYFEGEELIPRVFEDIRSNNNEVLLLCNKDYSCMITPSGSGYSKNNDNMLYRWKGNSTSDDSGMFFYIKNLNSNDYWSSTYEPCKDYGEKYKVEFSLDKAKFSRKDGNIETKMEIVPSLEDNFEIRKITLNNSGDKGRSLEITSYMEIVLASFSSDAVHPAFSNLFVETEYNEYENVIIGSRRGRVKDAKVPYIYHKIVVDGKIEGSITYETSRINFIGRNRTLKNPRAMDNDKALENTVGTVLDPIISMRTTIRLEPYEKREIYFITGTCESKEEALEICKENNKSYKLEKLFEKYHGKMQLELKNLEIKCSEANLFQRLASYIFYLHSGRLYREDYIKNISMHQKDLWAYGLSGDLPIVLLTIENENDMSLVVNVLKFHYYMKLKCVKIDLIIYNNEEISYDEPLQKNILSAINMSNENNNLNKPGGVHLYNKGTMTKEIKDLLIGICRLYIDSKKGSLLEQVKRCEEDLKQITKDVEDLKINTSSKAYEVDYKEYDHDIEYLDKKDLMKNVNIPIKSEDYNEITNSKKEFDEEFKCENLDFFNGYGGFSKEDNSYIIKLSNKKNTPAPWINVMSNEDFGCHISESGSSYTWCGNSRENKITPWSNDYIRDPLGEALYIRDDISKKYFSISPKPVQDNGEYIIKHGFGYSEFIHTVYDIKSKLEVFVPKNEKVKIQRITLENLSDANREISLFYYAKLVLGVYEYDSSRYISTYIMKEQDITINKDNKNKINIKQKVSYIGGNNPYSEYFGNLHGYLTIIGGENLKFTGDSKEFLGIGGEMSSPRALKYDTLSNRSGSIYDPCLAACAKVNLNKGEKKEIIILLGQDKEDNIEKIVEKYMISEKAKEELDKVKQYWKNFLGNIQVKTPLKSMDYMLNGWLLYQTLSCRYLSRSAFYQSGGAYGFRDQLQDSMALGVVDPKITKDQIIRSACRQYIEGDVQHWWHPVVNSGIRTRFSDDLLWLPYVTAEYINATGDYEILDKTAKYLEDEPLREGEDERYTIVNASTKEGTIYEHCLKAIEKALKFGPHNIPLMGSGDWNDGMSTVGNGGKGESVWLGWFLYSILDNFIFIADYKKDKKTKQNYEENKNFIKENLEKNAWDGGWYRRAYFDDKTPLGSRENPECQIDSIAQSWAIISGATKNDNVSHELLNKKDEVQCNFSNSKCKTESENNKCEFTYDECKTESDEVQLNFSERAMEAMEAVDRNLVKKDKGMILLLAPPFSNSYLEPGYIKGYVPGVRENGGQYTHAAVWVILALTKLNLGDKAVKYYDMINPINHTNTELECMTYKLEPYVMAADVYIKEPHGGRGGWSWYTGASGWMYRVGIENILGLKKVKDKGYTVRPCVPKNWKEYEINIKNETEDYSIKVIRREVSTNNTEMRVIVNKEEIKDKIIPRNLGKAKIEVYF